MDPDPLKSSPLMNRIHKRNADELRRNSISPGRRSITENSNKPRFGEDRPTTSRKVPNPNPDIYCDYVVQSPPSQRNKNGKEELILDYDSKTSDSYEDMNKGIDEAGANDLSILTSYLQKLTNRVNSIETKLTESNQNQESIKRKRASSPYAFYTPETKNTNGDSESEPVSSAQPDEDSEDEDNDNDNDNDEAGEESESGGSNGEGEDSSSSSSAEANSDSEKPPSPSDEDSESDIPIESKSPYRSTKEIYKDYEKVQELFQSLNKILPSLTPEQKKDTISRMEELIKISDSLKQEHTLSSAWEERNTPVHQRVVQTTNNNQDSNNQEENDNEEDDDEEEEVEEYNPESNDYHQQNQQQQQQQQQQSSPTKMRSAAEISNDIKQVHMLFAALKESLTICKASDWSNNIMSIFSERFEELGNELRNAEQYYKDHPMTPEKKRSSLSQQQQQQQQQQQNKSFSTPSIRIPPPKQPNSDEDLNIPLSCLVKTRNQNIKPTYDPLQRFRENDFNNDNDNDNDNDNNNERHSFSQMMLQKNHHSYDDNDINNIEPPRPHSEPNLDEIDENLDDDENNNNDDENNNNDDENYYNVPLLKLLSSSSQQQQQKPLSSSPQQQQKPLSSFYEQQSKYHTYSNEEKALSVEIENLQQEFIQLQKDLENAKTQQERQQMVYRLMKLEERFKTLNQKMSDLTNSVQGKKSRTENEIKSDIQICFAEFNKLKEEIEYASPVRKNEIIKRLMEIKSEMDELSIELEESSKVDEFSAPKIQPSVLKQQAQQKQQLKNNRELSGNVMERMQYIKDEFSKCKERLRTASPEEAKKIMERINELNDEAEEITRALNERSLENIQRQAEQDSRSMTYDELQSSIENNDKKINILIDKIQNSDSGNDDLDEYTNLVEYNKALQECLNDRNDSNKATPSSTTANSEEDDDVELKELYNRFLLLQKKIAIARPQDLPKYKQELINIQKDMTKLQLTKESQSTPTPTPTPPSQPQEEEDDDDEENQHDEREGGDDDTIQKLIYLAVIASKDCKTIDEKKVFFKKYFNEKLGGLGFNEELIEKFIDTALEIAKLQ